MPSPNTIATIAALAFALALALSTRMIRPLGSAQPRHGAAWLDAHDVPVEARHYRPAAEDEEADVVEPAGPADDTSPWAVPAVLATIPDALKARTA